MYDSYKSKPSIKIKIFQCHKKLNQKVRYKNLIHFDHIQSDNQQKEQDMKVQLREKFKEKLKLKNVIRSFKNIVNIKTTEFVSNFNHQLQNIQKTNYSINEIYYSDRHLFKSVPSLEIKPSFKQTKPTKQKLQINENFVNKWSEQLMISQLNNKKPALSYGGRRLSIQKTNSLAPGMNLLNSSKATKNSNPFLLRSIKSKIPKTLNRFQTLSISSDKSRYQQKNLLLPKYYSRVNKRRDVEKSYDSLVKQKRNNSAYKINIKRKCSIAPWDVHEQL